MRWGLIPYWAKDIKIGFSTINARAEEIDIKPAFQQRPSRATRQFVRMQKDRATGKQPFASALRAED